MLALKVYILIDEILRSRATGHLQGWFLVFYYCHAHEKWTYGYTSSGGWTFCEFADFQLFFNFWSTFDDISTYVLIYIPFFLFPGGCAPRTPARADGRAGGEPTLSTLFFWNFFRLISCTLFFLHFFRVYGPWEVSHLSCREISRRMHSESCLETPWGPSYEHIYKNLYLCKGWIGWQPRLKRALKTISNGILKVPNALGDFMPVLW